MAIIGIIAGSGLYDMPGLELLDERVMDTQYGRPSSPYKIGRVEGVEVAFLGRHGLDHSIPPHKINYRANIMGFKLLGAQRVISINATGGIAAHCAPGDIFVTDQVIDLTQGARQGTFFDSGDVAHIDFTEPFCPQMRTSALNAANTAGVKVHDRGTYICVNGPRLESRAEIKAFSMLGADIVGMTCMPEASLAREAELCMLTLSIVTNYAAGISKVKLTSTEVIENMAQANERIKTLVRQTLLGLPLERTCPCKDALQGAKI